MNPLAPSCHRPAAAGPLLQGVRRVALLGMPNTGKSTLFNCLTGGEARVANWPGLTVELLRGALPSDCHGRPYELVDLPGIHDLLGSSEDELVVRRFLEQHPPDLAVVVVNASQVNSQLRLALELQATGLPLLVVLNMADEAERFGVVVDQARLSEELQRPVLVISARRNQGIAELLRWIHQADQIHPAAPIALTPSGLDQRLLELNERCVQLPEGLFDQLSHQIDRVLLNPGVGMVAFLAVMLAMFQLIYAIGVPIQELMGLGFDAIQRSALLPALAVIGLPEFLIGLLSDGLWLGITTVISFMPIIFLFYLMIALIEDSGYLARSAFLMDGVMHWLGMDGRSFVLQIMGFGCNVPAIMGTRVIRDRSQRLLAMLVIPFSLCQARLAVFVFMAGAFFARPWWAPGLVIFGFYSMSFVAAILTALLFRHLYPSSEAFVLELPPYRLPSLATMLKKASLEMKNFFVTTRQFIIVGVIAIWLLNHLPLGVDQLAGQSFAGQIGLLTQPLLGPIGMNPQLTVSLIFGFIAKEILLGAMAVIYATSQADLGAAMVASITPLQALSFMMFTLLYTPCLSTVAIQLKESKSKAFTWLSVGWSLALAWLLAFLLYQGGLKLGLG
ncbi:ferrous iron transport protein B [Synechococcus sp. CS-1325]|uniref:ferrous iron transport protein B n=1 Tax=Synechococcus sp. CS-1325 TaxID=2847979 RepID=UPI000DB4517A|nr:ferrous iron transport protein B [Synechococcus sp. CS-1325]MCT0200293.1 ferrous iron transport protein B [Synechococcus sp. CS-1325]PZV01581.1 MAG: ferrous iron transport protein B [Cyanobium sp.]